MKLLAVSTPFALHVIILLNFGFPEISGVNIRSDLDFDDGPHKTGIINVQRDYIRPIIKTNKRDTPPPNTSVNCDSGGCNTTVAKNNPSSTDNLNTDIVVQVKVNTNEDKTKTKTSTSTAEEKSNKDQTDEDVPDVPVVVGYSGGGTPPARLIPPEINQQNFHTYQPVGHVKSGGFVPSSWGVNFEYKPRGHYPDDYTRYHVTQERPQNSWHSNNFGGGGRGGGSGVVGRQPPWHSANPTPWYYNRRVDYRPTQAPPPTATTCICHPNSVWSSPPSTQPSFNFNHPGKQINGKLAPLN